ncbi:MAG: hypothetical protein AB4080_12315 [Trichodesmium sp.]
MNFSVGKSTLKEIRDYGKYLWQKPSLPSNKFVIFGRGDSGSTLLVNLLESHNKIRCDGEILHDRLLFPRLYIDLCASRYQSDAYGFKLLSYQIRDIQSIYNQEKFLLNLYNSGYKFIYLTRSNLLHHALSNINARMKKFHHRLNEGKLSNNLIKVEIEQVLQMIKNSEKLGKYEQDLLRKIPHISLTYEDDLLHQEFHQKTVDKITELLDLPSLPVKTNLVKLMPLELSKMVENYEELIQAIKVSMHIFWMKIQNIN